MSKKISLTFIIGMLIVLFSLQNAIAKNDPRNIDQIQALISQFFYFDDAENIDEVMNLSTEDAVVDFGTGPMVGKEVFRAAFEGSYAATSMTRHVLTNPLISVNGRHATGKWYMTGFVIYEDTPETTLVIYGTLENTFRKVNGEWKVSSFIFQANWVDEQ